MTGKGKHVVPRHDGWAVRSSGASRAAKVFDNRQEAVSYARGLAKKAHGELYVHGKDGTIKERRSYGNDPVHPATKSKLPA